MDKRLKANLKRRIVNATTRLDAEYQFVTEERDEYNTKIANISYSPGEKAYGIECEVYDEKKDKYVPLAFAYINLTLERVLEMVEDFISKKGK